MDTYLQAGLTFTVNMPLEVAIQKLQEHVVKPGFTNMLSRKAFWGEVYSNTFNIHRNINYRNSALPYLEGELTTVENGTKISVSMRPDKATFTFLKTWVIGFTVTWLFLLYISGIFSFGTLILPVIFGVGIYCVNRGFWSEVATSTETLKSIFEQEANHPLKRDGEPTGVSE